MRIRTGMIPARQQAWNSIRILRGFTVIDLLCTIDGAKYGNIRGFVFDLYRHGILTRKPCVPNRHLGETHLYRLIMLNTPPTRPRICLVCGQDLDKKVCNASLKEIKTERKNKVRRVNPLLNRTTWGKSRQ